MNQVLPFHYYFCWTTHEGFRKTWPTHFGLVYPFQGIWAYPLPLRRGVGNAGNAIGISWKFYKLFNKTNHFFFSYLLTFSFHPCFPLNENWINIKIMNKNTLHCIECVVQATHFRQTARSKVPGPGGCCQRRDKTCADVQDGRESDGEFECLNISSFCHVMMICGMFLLKFWLIFVKKKTLPAYVTLPICVALSVYVTLPVCICDIYFFIFSNNKNSKNTKFCQ